MIGLRPPDRRPRWFRLAEEALSNAEQLAINTCDTAGKADDLSATLANRINAISKQRWEALEGLKVDIDRVRALLGP